MVFSSEKEMVEVIRNCSYLENFTLNKPSLVKEEVTGFFGVPDLVVVHKERNQTITHAYEAKLSNWKRALVQAYKYKSFANRSYVIMDHDRVKSVLANTDKFCRANVGLISIEENGDVHQHYIPYFETPYSPRLETKFNKKIACELCDF